MQSSTILQVEHVDGVAVVTLGERLDLARAADFRGELTAILEGPVRAVALDLRNLEFLDSSGLGAIVVTQGVNAPPGEIYFGADNPKGELGFYIHSKGGGTPNRLKIRSPSFVNLSVFPYLLPGNMISDVVAILGSFTL